MQSSRNRSEELNVGLWIWDDVYTDGGADNNALKFRVVAELEEEPVVVCVRLEDGIREPPAEPVLCVGSWEWAIVVMLFEFSRGCTRHQQLKRSLTDLSSGLDMSDQHS